MYGSLVLTISDHLGWDEATTDHLFFLQEKLNSYLRFIESGEVYEAHHDTRGRSIVISIVLKHTPPHEASALLDECREVIEAAGMGTYGFDERPCIRP